MYHHKLFTVLLLPLNLSGISRDSSSHSSYFSFMPFSFFSQHNLTRSFSFILDFFFGVMAGADGAMVEIHEEPTKASSDGEQSLYFDEFIKLMKNLKKLLVFRKEIIK